MSIPFPTNTYFAISDLVVRARRESIPYEVGESRAFREDRDDYCEFLPRFAFLCPQVFEHEVVFIFGMTLTVFSQKQVTLWFQNARQKKPVGARSDPLQPKLTFSSRSNAAKAGKTMK